MSQDISCVAYNTQYQRRINQIAQESASRRTWSRLSGFRANPLIADVSCGGTSTRLVDRYINKKEYMNRNNSNNVQHATSLTKAQVYARMARGNGPDGRPSKRYANQTVDYSNPNIYNLPQRGNRLIQDCRELTPGFTFEVAMTTWQQWLTDFSNDGSKLVPVYKASTTPGIPPWMKDTFFLPQWQGNDVMRVVINLDRNNIPTTAGSFGFNITKVLDLPNPNGSGRYFGPNNPYSINILDWYDMPFTISGEQLSNESGALTDKVIENAIGTPRFLEDCSMAKCFYMTSFSNSVLEKKVGNWNVTKVVDFTYTFANPQTSFNPNIFGSYWTCPNVISAEGMFFKCHNFNQSVSDIFTGSTALKDLSGTFYDCSGFNQNVNDWNTSKVLSMENMFYNAYIFNNGQAPSSTSTVGNFPLDNWDVECVTTMKCMFYNDTSFNQSLDTWWPVDVSDMSYMFYAKRTPRIFSTFNNGHTDPYHYQPYSSKGKPFWEEDATKGKRTTNLRITSHMFHNTFFAGDISGWDIANLIDASGMLHNCAMTPWTYSNMLIGWQNQASIKSNVPLGAMYAPQSDPGDPGWLDASFASGIQYLEAANSARNNPSTGLTGTAGGYQWDISDGGLLFFGDSMKVLFVSSNWTSIANSLQFDPSDKSVAWKGMPVHWTPGSAAAKNLITIHNSYPGHTIFEIGGINDEGFFPSPAGFSMKDVLTDLSNSNFNGPYGCTIIDWSGALFEPIQGRQFSVGPGPGFNFDCSWNGALPPVPSFYPTSPSLSVPNIRQNTSLESAFYYAQADVSFGSLGDGNYTWDVSGVTNMANMFNSCTTFNAALNWNVQNVIDMGGMFYNCYRFNQDIATWKTKKVTNMHFMFTNCNIFNNTLDWDVDNVVDMQHMFNGCKDLHQPITFNNLTQVTDMKYMFAGCTNFTGLGSNFNQWSVSKVSDMQYMFFNCSEFEGMNLSHWDVHNVINMQYMFHNASVFNEDISSWKVHKVTNMSYMFCNCSDFNQDISGWDVSMVNNMSYMFNGATKFISDISNWYVYNVTDMQYMFHSASKFSHDLGNWPIYHLNRVSNMFTDSLMATTYNKNSSRTVAGWLSYRNSAKDGAPNIVLDPLLTGWTNNGLFDYSYVFLGNPPNNFSNAGQNTPANKSTYGLASAWNVSRLPDASEGFKDNLTFNEDITPWDTANVTNMAYMFSGAQAFNKDIGGWDVQNVTNMAFMFSGAQAFNQNIGGWDVQNVTNMAFMFSGADSFNQNIDNWNVSNVSFMQYMFHDAKKFNNGGHDLKWISGTGTEQVKDMQRMFKNAQAFVGHGINNWNVSEVTDMREMFYIPLGATSVFNPPNPMVAADWNTAKVQDMSGMFYNCQALVWDNELFDWDLTKTTTTRFMFYCCYKFNGIMQITNTNKVTDMQYMFYNCTHFDDTQIWNWSTDNVLNMQGMFGACLIMNPTLNFNTENVTDMSGMFQYCSKFAGHGLSNWDVGEVTTMQSMFEMNDSQGNGVFDEDISGWHITGWSNGHPGMLSPSGKNMFDNCGMSPTNVTRLMINWILDVYNNNWNPSYLEFGMKNCLIYAAAIPQKWIGTYFEGKDVKYGMEQLQSTANWGGQFIGAPTPPYWPQETFPTSGGTCSSNGGYVTCKFTTSGTFKVNAGPAIDCSLLLVGGGGGGGGCNVSTISDGGIKDLIQPYILASGGGGGGSIKFCESTAMPGVTHHITVGTGGGGGTGYPGNGGSGTPSSSTNWPGGLLTTEYSRGAQGTVGNMSSVFQQGPGAPGFPDLPSPYTPRGGHTDSGGGMGGNSFYIPVLWKNYFYSGTNVSTGQKNSVKQYTQGIMGGGGGGSQYEPGGDASFCLGGDNNPPNIINYPNFQEYWPHHPWPDCSGGRGGKGVDTTDPTNPTGWVNFDPMSPILGAGGGGGAASGGSGGSGTYGQGDRIQMWWGPGGDWDGNFNNAPNIMTQAQGGPNSNVPSKGWGMPNQTAQNGTTVTTGWGAIACHEGFYGFCAPLLPPQYIPAHPTVPPSWQYHSVDTHNNLTNGADGGYGQKRWGCGGGGSALDVGVPPNVGGPQTNSKGGNGGDGVVYIKYYFTI